MIITVERSPRGVRMIDQRRLPLEEVYIECESAEEVAGAIRGMAVRGAPAIGIAAAYGLALGATRAARLSRTEFDARMRELGALMLDTRPTAVNLRWAVERLQRTAHSARAEGLDNGAVAERLELEALAIHVEDDAACRAMGRHGLRLVPDTATILTHCNAGGLATSGYGTALGLVRGAIEAGKKIRVLADETRPFLQGSRLTAWELLRDGIDVELITDGSAGSVLRSKEVDLVIVGADRIAANGDVANKIGTYPLAVLAKENGVPFYVAAPLSTIDLECPDGSRIPIEERDPGEVLELFGTRVAPRGARARNPAFDVTPARYVTAIVTERGIASPPYVVSLAELKNP